MLLREIAHSRTGDKGNRSTLSVIAYDLKDFAQIERYVTAESVKAHYQDMVHGPVERYVVADFSKVTLTQLGQDRVQVQGATGQPKPDALKVTVGYRDGFIGEGQMSYAGPGAQARGQLALDVLRHRLNAAGMGGFESRYELLGVNAIHGDTLSKGPEPYEVRVRVALRVPTRQQAEQVANEVEALYLNGPAGGGGATKSVREVIAAASILMPRDWVQTSVSILEM